MEVWINSSQCAIVLYSDRHPPPPPHPHIGGWVWWSHMRFEIQNPPVVAHYHGNSIYKHATQLPPSSGMGQHPVLAPPQASSGEQYHEGHLCPPHDLGQVQSVSACARYGIISTSFQYTCCSWGETQLTTYIITLVSLHLQQSTRM